jgi:hypothetical protein
MSNERGPKKRIEEAALNAKQIIDSGEYFPDRLKRGKDVYDDPQMIEECCGIGLYKEELGSIQKKLQDTFGRKLEFFVLTDEDYEMIARDCIETIVFLAENKRNEE